MLVRGGDDYRVDAVLGTTLLLLIVIIALW